MLLPRCDVPGRSEVERAAMLDAAHDAMVESFERPARDRCRVVHESDMTVSLVTTTDEDWSFGFGRGRFLTGEHRAAARTSAGREATWRSGRD